MAMEHAAEGWESLPRKIAHLVRYQQEGDHVPGFRGAPPLAPTRPVADAGRHDLLLDRRPGVRGGPAERDGRWPDGAIWRADQVPGGSEHLPAQADQRAAEGA